MRILPLRAALRRPPMGGVVAVPLVTCLLAALPAAGQRPDPAPLFASVEPLEIVLTADFDALAGDRDQDEEERDGTAVVTSPDGAILEIPVEIRTRGNFRLQRSTCRFPPLRLDVPRKRVAGSVMDGEDKLKLVGPCRDGEEWDQRVLKEYLVYRLFNEITDKSFRVRLARITYVQAAETGGPEEARTHWGFLIEDEDRLAERLGGALLDVEEIHPARLVGENTGPVVLFQYMVGNTDFSLFGDHNVKLVERGRRVIPVPYDFDWTGVVDAPYAEPDPSLGIRSVRDRVFRGLCRPDVDYDGLYARFRERRAAMEELIRGQVGLDPEARDDVVDYLNGFWRIIDDPDEAGRRIERACRRA